MKKSGFTLIETVIYIALLSFILGAVIFSVYQIMDSKIKLQQETDYLEEENFILKKIDWVLTEVSQIDLINPQHLQIVKQNQETIKLRLDNGEMQLKTNNDPWVKITSDRLKIKNLVFQKIISSENFPDGLAIKIDTDQFNIDVIKYLKK